MSFWRAFILINIVVSALVIIWFAIGGMKDLKDMLRRLKTMVRDHRDDGFVTGRMNRDEVEAQAESAGKDTP